LVDGRIGVVISQRRKTVDRGLEISDFGFWGLEEQGFPCNRKSQKRNPVTPFGVSAWSQERVRWMKAKKEPKTISSFQVFRIQRNEALGIGIPGIMKWDAPKGLALGHRTGSYGEG
jgi:hypothetical protein